jgi:hypothetical protein
MYSIEQQQNNFQVFSDSIATTTINPAVTAETHFSAIAHLDVDPDAKSMVERTVIHVTLPTAKKKKHKKKPPTATQQAVVAEQLGDSFSLAETAPKQTIERYSLFSKSYCPKFTEEEQKVFVESLKQNAFCENTNLFEVFMVDFSEQWSNVIAHATAYDINLGEHAKEVIEENDILVKFHCFYLYTFGKENDITELNIDDYYTVDFFTKSSDFLIRLNNYLTILSIFMMSVETKHTTRKISKLKSIQGVKESKYNSLCQSLNLLKIKVIILSKCVQSNDVGALFLKTKVVNLIEAYDSSMNSTAQLAKVAKFYAFIKKIAILSGKTSKVFQNIIACIDGIEKMIASKFNKSSSMEFMAAFRQYSISSLRMQLNFFGYLKDSEDPSYTYAVFCKQQGFTDTSNKTQKEFRSLLLRTNLNLDIFDKWVNNSYQEVSRHLKTESLEVNFRAPQDHIQRLLSMLNLINTCASYGEDNEPEIMNVFHGKINEKISIAIAKHELQYKLAFNTVSLNKVFNSLKYQMSLSSFRLSHCQFSVVPILEKIQIHGSSFYTLDEIRRNILQLIRDAKQNDELGDWEPNTLKRVIQDMLFRKALPLYIYIMIIEDTKALFKPSRPTDILHLLPNEMVRLLDLTGFDEIFSEKPTCEALSGSPLQEELLECQEELKFQEETKYEEETKFQSDQLPSTSGLTKTQTTMTIKKVAKNASSFLESNNVQQEVERLYSMPEKQDFIDSVKKPMIARLLNAMNIFYDHTGRHDVFRHAETSGVVVVPNHLDAIGTRLSVFFQALAAQPK